MRRFIPRRTLEALLALLGLSLVVFFMLHLDHTDPARGMLGKAWTPQRGAALDSELGLNQPVFVQYLLWMRALFRVGGLGTVIKYELPPTLELLIMSITVALVTSICLAQWQIHAPGRFVDRFVSVVTGMLSAVPGFVMGSVLLYFLAFNVSWFPPNALTPRGSGPLEWIHYHTLPTAALAVSVIGPWTRQLRTSLGAEAQSDYVRTARSKGTRENRVIAKHMRRNAILPLISLVGLSLPTMMNTLIAVEIIYGVQGAGTALISSLDVSLFAQATTVALVFAFLSIFGSMMADLVYGLVDPRIQYR
jgi:peptide/nickel transport system permease protein